MRTGQIDKLSYRELLVLEVRVRNAMVMARDRERAALAKRVRNMLAGHGMTAKEVFANGRAKNGRRKKRQ